jgi:hypothetical protein
LLTVTSTRTPQLYELVRRPRPDVPVAGEALRNRSDLQLAQLLPRRLSLDTNNRPHVPAPELRSESASLANFEVLAIETDCHRRLADHHGLELVGPGPTMRHDLCVCDQSV